MEKDYHAIVIGAGSAGLVASAALSSLGARVALIERDRMGGDCLNTGCVPSKALLRSAHLARDIVESSRLGLEADLHDVHLDRVLEHVHESIRTIAPKDSRERFESLGVQVIHGEARMSGTREVEVSGQRITGKNIVLATGSRPVVPPIPGLQENGCLTNETIFSLKKLPEKLIILGGGAIGCELGQAFNNLGSEVHIVDMTPHLFWRDEPEVAPIMESILVREGIHLHLNAKIVKVQKVKGREQVILEKEKHEYAIEGTDILAALGRRPETGNLGLREIGVKLDERGFIRTDASLRTNIPHIYACGDAAGPWLFTHMAGYQGGVVARNITVPLFKKKVDYRAVPRVTYTRPEVAHTGMTEEEARRNSSLKRTICVPLEENDRACTELDRKGFLKLILGKGNRVLGASMVGGRAGDMISMASLAVQKGMKSGDLLSIIYPYPTEMEMFSSAAMIPVREKLTPGIRALIQKLIFR
jgi:pyruvate/2-oxoglutarate dehydrogenase complex dihydrolipoamide dehydrogenase (E3) component